MQVATLLADESQKSLKVFCALCNQIYHDPHITSCGVSTRNPDPLIVALTRSPHSNTQHTFCRRCASADTEGNNALILCHLASVMVHKSRLPCASFFTTDYGVHAVIPISSLYYISIMQHGFYTPQCVLWTAQNSLYLSGIWP